MKKGLLVALFAIVSLAGVLSTTGTAEAKSVKCKLAKVNPANPAIHYWVCNNIRP